MKSLHDLSSENSHPKRNSGNEQHRKDEHPKPNDKSTIYLLNQDFDTNETKHFHNFETSLLMTNQDENSYVATSESESPLLHEYVLTKTEPSLLKSTIFYN